MPSPKNTLSGVRRESAKNGESDTEKETHENGKTKEPTSAETALALVPVQHTLADRHNEATEKAILGGLFSTKKPKDAAAGLSSAVKSVSKGVAIGAASLFVLPVVGASEQGIGGFFKGIGAGVFAAVALPVTGVCVAGYQLSRGIINTPEAIHEKSQGKKWDKKGRVWKPKWYSLPEEAAEVLNTPNPHKSDDLGANSSSSAASGNSEGQNVNKNNDGKPVTVVETEYYDVLEMTPDATQDQIRRQYYKLARKYHPDKNPDDPQAKIRFQKIGEAYQVLGDEDRRQKYDKFGSAAAQDMPLIDSSLFFTMLFGSEELEPFIGKLKMAMFVEQVDGQPGNSNSVEAMMEFEQCKREVQLALLIVERVQPFVDAQDTSTTPEDSKRAIEAWKTDIRSQAVELCNSSFGDAIVEAVAWTYQNYATQYLGKLDTFLGIGGRYAKMQAQGRFMGNSWKTASTAVRAAIAARHIQQKEKSRNKKKGKDDDNDDGTAQARQLEETLPLILETMLNICLIDIETTVRSSAKKAVKDMSVSIHVRRARAEALVEIGRLFQEEAEAFRKAHKDEKLDPLRRMEDAFIKAAQKADEERYKREGDHTGPAPSAHQPVDPASFL